VNEDLLIDCRWHESMPSILCAEHLVGRREPAAISA
jgi:hypothetical protein